MQRMVYVPPGGNVELPETCVEFSLAPPYIIGSVTGTGGPETTVISSSVPVPPGKAIKTSPSSIILLLRSNMSFVTISFVSPSC